MCSVAGCGMAIRASYGICCHCNRARMKWGTPDCPVCGQARRLQCEHARNRCEGTGCTATLLWRRYCLYCEQKLKRYGTTACIAPTGCDRKQRREGLCYVHWERVKRTGFYELPPAHLPAAPLLAAIDARGGMGPAMRSRGFHGNSRQALEKLYKRLREGRPVNVYVADSFCIRVLGVHPVAVYGEDWWLNEGLLGA
jgi:hypothetical protein